MAVLAWNGSVSESMLPIYPSTSSGAHNPMERFETVEKRVWFWVPLDHSEV